LRPALSKTPASATMARLAQEAAANMHPSSMGAPGVPTPAGDDRPSRSMDF
jgi:hypothetical protein